MRAVRVAGWNALLVIAGAGAAAIGAEAYLRLTTPFVHVSHARSFHPQAGRIGVPGAEVRWTNGLDFWTISRNNSLGFLDREPPRRERAAASCHVAILGDSFVEARQVPVGDKLQVRLEELAAQRLPSANVTTSAFGISGAGQVAQVGYYDAFVRPLRPRLVVLVFVPNDLIDNAPVWRAIANGVHPRHQPFVSAVRERGGGMRLQPPDPAYAQHRLPAPASVSRLDRAARRSRLARWLSAKARVLWPAGDEAAQRARAELLSRDPELAAELAGWSYAAHGSARSLSAPPSSFVEGALDYTAFALDQFKERARRDRFSLVILITHRAAYGSDYMGERLAVRHGIPVIDQAEYILLQGGELRDAAWRHNDHWSPAGHRWAAEALLEHLRRHPEICAPETTARVPGNR